LRHGTLSASEKLRQKKRENSRYCKVEPAFMEQFWEKWAIHLPAMFTKNLLMFNDVSKTLKMVRNDMWFDSSNESFNTEVAPNNILVQGILISIHNYKIRVFRLLLLRCLPS
jgi:hypothetical protein